MPIIRRRALLPLLALCCAPSLALAQGPCRGFRVEVREAATGAALPGASVRIVRARGDTVLRAGVTDERGIFRAAGGGGGGDRYRVEASAPGHAPGTAITSCPSAGTGAATISLARAAAPAVDSASAASWLVLARDERVEISFDGAHVRRVGPSRHRVLIRWNYAEVQGGEGAEPFRYDRVETQVEADCRARTRSNGDETYYLAGRVVHSKMGLWHPGGPPVPGSIGERSTTELCKYLTM